MRLIFVFVFLFGLVSCGEEKSSSSSSSDSSSVGESIILEPEKQPNCDEIDGFLSKLNNFTGILKDCENGKVRYFDTYKNSKKNGVSKRWHMSTGHQKYIQNYNDGKKHGLWCMWHESGQIFRWTKYENDTLVDQKVWNKNGTLAFEMNRGAIIKIDGTRLIIKH